MDSLKKAKDSIEGFIQLADFLKEVKEKLPKSENLPTQVKNLEHMRDQLAKEVVELQAKKSKLASEFQSEHEHKIQELEKGIKDLDIAKSVFESEKSKVRNDAMTNQNKSIELKSLMAQYGDGIKEYQEKVRQLDEKVKKIGELTSVR